MTKEVDHKAAREFADQILRYPAPLDRSKVELLARAYVQLSNETLHKAQDEWEDAFDAHIKSEAQELGVSENCASNIFYLRTRSRWTQEAEDELIRMDKAGEGQPNINEWP